MTPDQAQKFVRYTLDKMTEGEHTAALLALRYCDRDALREIDSAEKQALGRLTPLERERLQRVASRYNEEAQREDEYESHEQECPDGPWPAKGGNR